MSKAAVMRGAVFGKSVVPCHSYGGNTAWSGECPHERSVQLWLIEPGKPNQNACIESFNGRQFDECLNENWFPSLLQARTETERWRRERYSSVTKRNAGRRGCRV
jgi:transposase InsO family protein